MLLALPSLWSGLMFDDFIIRATAQGRRTIEAVDANPWEPFTFLTDNARQRRAILDRGLCPWWTDPRCRVAFMRPLAALTHMLDYRVWPGRLMLMHAQSLAWFALLIFAAATLYRRLMCPGTVPIFPQEKWDCPPSTANDSGTVPIFPKGKWDCPPTNPDVSRLSLFAPIVAGLVFTMDRGHANPVAWLANRSALMAGVFGVLALLAHDRWRRDGWRPGPLLATLALAAALLAKEVGVCTAAYLLAYALFVDRGPWRRRLLSLLPYLAVGLAWYGCYKALGFGVSGSGVYVDPGREPLRYAQQAAWIAPLLITGQMGLPDADAALMASTSVFRIHLAWAVAFVVLLGTVLWPLLRRDSLARFWALGMLLSLLPACAAFASNRVLMFVSIGAAGLTGQFLGGLKQRAEWLPRTVSWKWLARAFACLFVLVHLVLAPLAFLGSLGSMIFLKQHVAVLADSLPDEGRLVERTAIVVNSASWFLDLGTVETRDYLGQPVPARMLTVNGAGQKPILSRPDATTLVARSRVGLLPPRGTFPDPDQPPPPYSMVYLLQVLDLIVRGPDRPMALGEKVELKTATIEITDLTEDGRPAEATFRFRVPLEDPSLLWLEHTNDGYVPFKPPPVEVE